MSKDKNKLIELYREMYDHTKQKCHPPRCKIYNSPIRCCSPEYCDLTIQYAKDIWNIDLEVTGHEYLPLMGPDGCIVEPHLRPICTVHDCLINSLGFDPEDGKWTKKYFRLRRQIDKLECSLHYDKISQI